VTSDHGGLYAVEKMQLTTVDNEIYEVPDMGLE
jgi:hypothetical protein